MRGSEDRNDNEEQGVDAGSTREASPEDAPAAGAFDIPAPIETPVSRPGPRRDSRLCLGPDVLQNQRLRIFKLERELAGLFGV